MIVEGASRDFSHGVLLDDAMGDLASRSKPAPPHGRRLLRSGDRHGRGQGLELGAPRRRRDHRTQTNLEKPTAIELLDELSQSGQAHRRQLERSGTAGDHHARGGGIYGRAGVADAHPEVLAADRAAGSAPPRLRSRPVPPPPRRACTARAATHPTTAAALEGGRHRAAQPHLERLLHGQGRELDVTEAAGARRPQQRRRLHRRGGCPCCGDCGPARRLSHDARRPLP